MTLIVTIVFNVIGLAGTYLAAAMHRELPLTRWLDRMPAPRLPRRTPQTGTAVAAPAAVPPRSGARNDTRSRPRVEPAAKAQGRSRGTAGDRTRDNPRAAGAASARGAQPSGRRSLLQWLIRPKGCHAASTDPLGLRWDGLQGRYRHAETGPMAAIPAGYGADLRSAGKLVAP